MKKILFDTNFLIDIARFRIDLDEIDEQVNEPYRLLTIDKVVKELKSINNKDAKVALKLIELRKVKIEKTSGKYADKAIIDLADKDIIVATNDSKLRKKLIKHKIKTIYLRKRKYLAID